MYSLIKKLIFAASFNLCLFLILVIGIQNSSKKSKVDLLFSESVNLPISFIVGTSFISGSLFGSLISFYSRTKNNLDWNKHFWTYNSWNTSWKKNWRNYFKYIWIRNLNNFFIFMTWSFCIMQFKKYFYSFSI